MKGFFFVVSFTETCIYKGERTFESGIVGNLGNNRESREGVAADAATSIYGECAAADAATSIYGERAQAGEFLPAERVDDKGN